MTLGEYDKQQKIELIESTFEKVREVIDCNLKTTDVRIKKGLDRLDEAEFWIKKGILDEENRIN